jgi:hypothetical protein
MEKSGDKLVGRLVRQNRDKPVEKRGETGQ